MRKIFLILLTGLLCGSVFAQEAPGASEKNAGNAALREKNYKDAFLNLEKYLEIVNYSDKAVVYNVAYAASKIKNYIAAEKYFDMSVKNNYKTASSYLGKAQSQEKLNKDADMIKTLEAGLKAFPGNDKLENMYGTYFLKEGLAAQNAKNEKKAVECFSKALKLNNKSLKAKGNMSLALMYYNNGAMIMQNATPHANTDKALYDSEKTKAGNEFKKALQYANAAKTLTPTDSSVTDLIKDLQEAMK